MIIAEQLRKTNYAEYILYLWQVEDILRAYDCNYERLAAEYLPRFDLTADKAGDVSRWYADLCEMMHAEGKTTGGHLQISQNALSRISELHSRLMASARFPYYHEMYYKVLPYIVELRAKGENKDKTELEICLDALYGVMLLRIKKQPISPETQKAAADIATLLGQLADYYRKNEQQPIDFDE